MCFQMGEGMQGWAKECKQTLDAEKDKETESPWEEAPGGTGPANTWFYPYKTHWISALWDC